LHARPWQTRASDLQEDPLDPVLALLSITGAMIVGAISPGPSFVFVVRTSLATSRRDGIAAAFGMGVGAVTLATLALLGVRALLVNVDWAYAGFKIIGGLYLLYLAYGLWRGAKAPLAETEELSMRGRTGILRSFGLALATQLSNPKAVVIIGSIFAALLPAHVPTWMYLAIPPIIMTTETTWYTLVALVVSSEKPRAAYARSKAWIDRLAGTVMGALGLRLIAELGSSA
jgi:threonine/homoserine/homoserine lactone efflux protein